MKIGLAGLALAVAVEGKAPGRASGAWLERSGADVATKEFRT